MVLAELGADHVAFGPAPAWETGRGRACRANRLVGVVPCVAWNVETLEEAANLAALGVDFVALSSTIWETEGAAERIGKIETALLAALSMA